MSNAIFERCVLIGTGSVGAMLVEVLRDRVSELVLVDRASTAAILHWDVFQPLTAPVRTALAEADLIVLALPDDALRAALGAVVPALEPPALVVDTASVKAPFVPLQDASSGVAFLGVNPMFAPDLDPHGRAVLAVQPRDCEAASAFLGLLAERGMRIVAVSDAAEHDLLAATTQAAAHAAALSFALAARASGLDAEQVLAVAPPPCRTLLRLVARMGELAPEVYADVQSGNPQAATSRAALITALADLDADIRGGRGVTGAIDDALGWLGPARTALATECARMFAQ